MPTTLGPPFTTDFAGVPPHMSTQDYDIWLRFRSALPPTTRALYFDVRLGTGYQLGDEHDDDAKTMWYQLTAKRADVVVELPAGWLMVELRDHAQSSAIGRLLMYKKLWQAEPPDSQPLSLMLVTNTRDPDVQALAADHGIGYQIV